MTDRLRRDLAKLDGTLWHARELLLEWAAVEERGGDGIDTIRQRSRLLLETRTFLFTTPDVVTIPPISGAANPDGEVGFVAPDPLDAA